MMDLAALRVASRALPLTVFLYAPPAMADRYDDVIGAAFPGFGILAPSDISLRKEDTEPGLYARVNDRPALTAGDFNGDGRPDFAALIRRAVKTRDQYSEFYEAYFVVCYGLGGGKFDCVAMTPRPFQMHLPHHFFLATVTPGKYSCFGSRIHDARSPKPGDDTSDMELTTKNDAIGHFRTLGNGDVMYVHRTKTRYTLCILSD